MSGTLEYILQDFLFGIGIWLWAVENLESNHHVSVVHGIISSTFQISRT